MAATSPAGEAASATPSVVWQTVPDEEYRHCHILSDTEIEVAMLLFRQDGTLVPALAAAFAASVGVGHLTLAKKLDAQRFCVGSPQYRYPMKEGADARTEFAYARIHFIFDLSREEARVSFHPAETEECSCGEFLGASGPVPGVVALTMENCGCAKCAKDAWAGYIEKAREFLESQAGHEPTVESEPTEGVVVTP